MKVEPLDNLDDITEVKPVDQRLSAMIQQRVSTLAQPRKSRGSIKPRVPMDKETFKKRRASERSSGGGCKSPEKDMLYIDLNLLFALPGRVMF